MSGTRACIFALAAAVLLGSPAPADAGSIFSSPVRPELMFGDAPVTRALPETPTDLDARLAEILPEDGDIAPIRDILILDTETVVTGVALHAVAENIAAGVEEEALSITTVREVQWNPGTSIERCIAPDCPLLVPSLGGGHFISQLVPDISQTTIDALRASIDGLNPR